jgi:mannose-1-phosphate guanylyltransferase
VEHCVRDEWPFEEVTRGAIAASENHIVLVGAVPDHPETQYGWIVTRDAPGPTRRVACFCEKPPLALAERLLRGGALWNTLVMVGSASRLPISDFSHDVFRKPVT